MAERINLSEQKVRHGKQLTTLDVITKRICSAVGRWLILLGIALFPKDHQRLWLDMLETAERGCQEALIYGEQVTITVTPPKGQQDVRS